MAELRSASDPPDDYDLTQMELGYSWCRPHQDYHRPPECPIDEAGAPAPHWADDEAGALARVD